MKQAPDDSIEIDWEKMNWEEVENCALALLYFGLHEGYRTWKGFDWEILNRLHARGYISNPVGKAKSVDFSDEGLARSIELVFAKFVHR